MTCRPLHCRIFERDRDRPGLSKLGRQSNLEVARALLDDMDNCRGLAPILCSKWTREGGGSEYEDMSPQNAWLVMKQIKVTEAVQEPLPALIEGWRESFPS